MRLTPRLLTGAVFAAIIALVPCPRAIAAEGRPWLCRDKPVFSAAQPMRYQLTASSSRHWRLYLMRFSPGGSHDGFDIADSVDLPGGSSQSGSLPAGRYFAVALYRSGREWICPQAAQDNPSGTQISNLCYAESSGCAVRLSVTAAPAATGARAP